MGLNLDTPAKTPRMHLSKRLQQLVTIGWFAYPKKGYPKGFKIVLYSFDPYQTHIIPKYRPNRTPSSPSSQLCPLLGPRDRKLSDLLQHSLLMALPGFFSPEPQKNQFYISVCFRCYFLGWRFFDDVIFLLVFLGFFCFYDVLLLLLRVFLGNVSFLGGTHFSLSQTSKVDQK